MPKWSQHDVHTYMQVYSSDQQDLGHITAIYEESFLVSKGVIFQDKRYYPYSTIARIEDERVGLTMSADEANLLEWTKRPDYENHLGDPLQLFYDRGHGIHDPFDETNPDRT